MLNAFRVYGTQLRVEGFYSLFFVFWLRLGLYSSRSFTLWVFRLYSRAVQFRVSGCVDLA